MTYEGPPPTGAPYPSPEDYWRQYQPPGTPAPEPPTGSRHATPSRRPKWVLPTVLAVVVLVVAGAAAGIAIALTGGSSSSFTTTGNLKLTSDSIDASSDGCAGTGGYSDMSVGVSVKVSDPTGKIVALGEVDQAFSVTSGECTLHFTVDRIPAGQKIYSVEVSHRGALPYTEKELRAGLSLTLGD